MANVDGETLKITSAVVTVSEEILFLWGDKIWLI
jgi:hypothetical protein